MDRNLNYEALGFYEIIDMLKEEAMSNQAKEQLAQLTPFLDEQVCKNKMNETTVAKATA